MRPGAAGVLWALCLTTVADEPAPRLLGCWGLDETEGLTVHERSGQREPGQILRASQGVKRVPGRSGMALEFTGGDPAERGKAGGVQLRGLEQVDWSKGLTVELWVQFHQLHRDATMEAGARWND